MPTPERKAAIESAEAAIKRMRPWTRGSTQAPHKPLMLLLALRRVAEGRPRLVAFPDVEPELRDLIARFSDVKSPPNAGYPFWRLQADGIWEIEEADTFPTRMSNTDPPLRELRGRPARGGFPDQLDAALRAQPAEVQRLANLVARRFFNPEDNVLRVVELEPEDR